MAKPDANDYKIEAVDCDDSHSTPLLNKNAGPQQKLAYYGNIEDYGTDS